MTDQAPLRFATSGGRVLGVVGLALVALIVATGVLADDAGYHPAVFASCGIAAMLLWAGLVRPAVIVDGDDLVLRGMVDTVRIPLAAIERVEVHHFLAVGVGGRDYTSPAVGRSHRQILREGRSPDAAAATSYGGMVEARLRGLAENARDRQGIRPETERQFALADDVRRDWAWPEIALFAAFALGLLLTLLV